MTSDASQNRTRRAVLHGAAALSTGVASMAVAGCGTREPQPAQTPEGPVDLGSPAEIPVGGSRIYRKQRVVVSQPTDGSYEAFSAVCTHKGCVLTGVRELTADCGCHGSRFDTTTGEVLQGPATTPLPRLRVTAEDGKLTAGPAAG